MYSVVLLAALTAAPETPQALLCPVSPSNYGSTFWLKHCFYDCCAPARYGWVNCWNKGFSFHPGGRGFCGGCAPSVGYFYQPSACGPCSYGGACGSGACGHGWSHGWCGTANLCGKTTWCGRDWSIGCTPAFYTSFAGCPPQMTAPPYAYYTEKCPCGTYGHFAFDSGLKGHSSGVGYAGFGGYGNFGFYGAVPMQHPPTTADIPRFNPNQYAMPSHIAGPSPSYGVPSYAIPNHGTPGSITVPPSTNIVPPTNPGISPSTPLNPPTDLIPKPPAIPPIPLPEEPKKIEKGQISAPATVTLNVPTGAKVFVETHQLKGESAERIFRTPNLEPGQEYVYTVKAYITLGGTEHVEAKQVTVKAGVTSQASFDELLAKVQALKPNVVNVGGQK